MNLFHLLPSIFVDAIAGLREARNLIADPASINITSVNQMAHFSGLFGRETAYVVFNTDEFMNHNNKANYKEDC